MNNRYLGLDLGTSALKAVLLENQQIIRSILVPYEGRKVSRFYDAVLQAFRALKPEEKADSLKGIAISSQVGTYILDGEKEISWSSALGEEELPGLLDRYPEDVFVKRLGMNHPLLVSYPLPRFLAIRKAYPNVRQIRMEKDDLLYRLTGQDVSDPFTWRGLAKQDGSLSYADSFLTELNLPFSFPKLRHPGDKAGTLLPIVKEAAGITGDPTVYVGANDFYLGLLGQGIVKEGMGFDLGGTSEHLGYVSSSLVKDRKLISSPYFAGNVTYGGTASSGVSLDFGRSLATSWDIKTCLSHNPPLFLPYLQGERAPIYDPDIRGAFYGIHAGTNKEDLAYAVYEGVAFSLKNIAEYFPYHPNSYRLSGGAIADPRLSVLKATALGATCYPVKEKDASALGAALLAEASDTKQDLLTLSGAMGQVGEAIDPDPTIRPQLDERFICYKRLYQALKPMEMKGGMKSL